MLVITPKHLNAANNPLLKIKNNTLRISRTQTQREDISCSIVRSKDMIFIKLTNPF